MSVIGADQSKAKRKERSRMVSVLEIQRQANIVLQSRINIKIAYYSPFLPD